MSAHVLNIDDVEYQPFGHGDKFEAQLGSISRRIGARKLGYNVTVVPPGKRAFPFHSHRVNEEMFFVLEGTGELRLGSETIPVRAGDVVACPPGGPETAHQFINTASEGNLKYLGVSTEEWPEIAEYPDSGKTGVLAYFPGVDGNDTTMRYMVRDQATMEDYWEGE